MGSLKSVLKCILGLLNLISLACGGVVIGVGIWFGVSATWDFLPVALASWGGVIMLLSVVGLLVSCGYDCGNCLLGSYAIVMLVVSIGNIIFVAMAGVRKDDWITSMAQSVSNGEYSQQMTSVEKFYTDHWSLFLAFLAATAGSGFLGSVFAFLIFANHSKFAKYRGRADFEAQLPASFSAAGPNGPAGLAYVKKPRGNWITGMFGKRNKEENLQTSFIPTGVPVSASPEAVVPAKSMRLSRVIKDGRALQVEMKGALNDSARASDYYKEKTEEAKVKLTKSASLMKSPSRPRK